MTSFFGCIVLLLSFCVVDVKRSGKTQNVPDGGFPSPPGEQDKPLLRRVERVELYVGTEGIAQKHAQQGTGASQEPPQGAVPQLKPEQQAGCGQQQLDGRQD